MRNWILISRLIIGGYLTIAGLIHANDVIGFSYQLEDFFNASELSSLKSTKVLQAGLYSFLKLFAGVMLLFGQKPKVSILLATLILLVEIVSYSMILFRPFEIQSLFSWVHYSIDIILLILCLLLFRKRREINGLFSGKWTKVAIATNLIVSFSIPAYSCNFLPIIDCSSFSVGVDLKSNVKQEIQNFQVFDLDENNVTPQLLSYDGHQFILVIEQIENCHFKSLAKFNELSKNAEIADIPFYGLTSNNPSMIEDFRHEVQAAYPFIKADQHVLRQIVRSNPGLILLKGSTILGKWHFNSVPTFEDLNSGFKLKSGGPSFIQ
jgi:triosephosphate isomerase